MNSATHVSVVVILVATACCAAQGAEPYDLQAADGFLKLPEGLTLGACSAVAVSGKGEIFLFHRGPQPILVFDAEGKSLRSWGDGVIDTAHGLRIDHDDNVWVTDIGLHRVFKFDPQGKLLLALGTGQPGAGVDQFNKPTDVAFGADGAIYISDGYGNARVLKFTPGGRLIGGWGMPGKRKAEFNLPHSIVVDGAGRVLVGDRENNRIQVFDGDGKLLDIWAGFAPYGLTFDAAGTLFVADGRANKVLRLSSTGKVEKSWGGKGTTPGKFDLPHMLCFDSAGNLLVAEVNGKRLQKLVKQ
jgi:DNA-binding beta-propeller fold protein YncE